MEKYIVLKFMKKTVQKIDLLKELIFFIFNQIIRKIFDGHLLFNIHQSSYHHKNRKDQTNQMTFFFE